MPVDSDMTCDDVRAALSAAEGGALAPGQEEHLRGCEACRRWSVALERLADRLTAFGAPVPGEEFEGAVMARLRTRRPMPRWALVAAELLVFALGALAGLGAMKVTSGGPATAAAAPDPAAPMEPLEIVMRD